MQFDTSNLKKKSEPFVAMAVTKEMAPRSIVTSLFQFVPSHVWGANSKVQFGGIGSGGKGKADIGGSVGAGMACTALVDIVDVEKFSQADAGGSVKSRLNSITEAREKFPDAKFYTDYREMIDDMGDKIDAVTVSTPDHVHAHASVAAMKKDCAVYWSIWIDQILC